jgi:hypothetical protein
MDVLDVANELVIAGRYQPHLTSRLAFPPL